MIQRSIIHIFPFKTSYHINILHAHIVFLCVSQIKKNILAIFVVCRPPPLYNNKKPALCNDIGIFDLYLCILRVCV